MHILEHIIRLSNVRELTRKNKREKINYQSLISNIVRETAAIPKNRLHQTFNLKHQMHLLFKS